MSKQTSNCTQPEANENDFETPLNPIHFPPPRTPLNAIADPSQFAHDSDFDSSYFATKFESLRHGRYSLSDRKLEARGNVGKAHSEPNSAQSTPTRRISVGGVIGACHGSRVSLHTWNKAGSSRACRAISAVNSELPDEIPHFELVQDSSFWTDHNVQVLIRIRPLSSRERASPGYSRCLKQESAQTMVWLGHPETRFTFDHIACETISQESLFRVAGLPMVENCLSGYNSCMFAYGQTGSGKTYTMMGEIYEIEGKFNEDCGITPRIFEYLFQRIQAEEESRKNEQLKYSCKCSFLEIYNEQITDLLEPSSNNLQIREDLKKGVYVENLTEYNVGNVRDVVKLLLQGAVNRKMAATHMNSESSRSHSVFTCTIESSWEKDSMNHFRFARLNLVDLSGSERQKSSGAEGDRLKEAANINKSLSTLGLVIMSLVDLAHGKHRHVPYRDSRLTFLLQDSLGGNSKTTIIANVSPSICSANETLSTLKFAQRAKLIQNNAKVNEDASGDINALQRQIQKLKGQLSFLMKHNYQLSSCVTNSQESRFNDLPEEYHSLGEELANDNRMAQCFQNKIKCMEASLAGALRREKVAETAIQKLEAELERMNHLACQGEEDSQHTKMMLKFRDEKIKRLELLVDGMLSAETYLMQENKTLLEEIQLLRAKIDRYPELSQISLENNRLREQLQSIQNFYEHGERETLLAEVSELRNQLLEKLEGKDKDSVKELEHCRNLNSKLIREVDELRLGLGKYINCCQVASDSVTDSFSKDTEEFRQPDKYSLVESISLQSDAGDEMASYTQTDDEAVLNHIDQYMDGGPVIPPNIRKELIEVMEPKQVCLNGKLQHVQDESCRYMEISSCKDNLEKESVLKPENKFSKVNGLDKQHNGQVMDSNGEIERIALQAKLDRMTKDLEEVRLLNSKLQEDQELQLSSQHETELVREQVEVETARTILQLQEEVAALQCELDGRLDYVTRENTKLRNTVEAKEKKIKEVGMEWERAIAELTGFLVDGSRSLNNVSGQIESIACSFPQANAWISEHVVRAAKVCIEREETILHLQRSLEDAQNMAMEMGQKLSSLKGATLALTEFQQLDNTEVSEEECQLSMLLNEKTNMVKMLKRKLKVKEDQVIEAEKYANVAFLVINWLFDRHKVAQMGETEDSIPISKMANHKIAQVKDDANALVLEDIIAQVELAKSGVFESENALNAIYAHTEMHIKALQTNIYEISHTYRELVRNLVKEIQDMRMAYTEVREQGKISECCTAHTPPLEEDRCLKFKNLYHMLHQIRDEINETNERLKVIEDFINTEVNASECSSMDGGLVNADSWSTDCSSSSSDLSTASVESEIKFHKSSWTCCTKVEGSILLSTDEGSKNSKFLKGPMYYLKKELKTICDSFKKLYVRLTTLVDDSDSGESSYAELKQLVPSCKLRMEVKAGFHNPIEVEGDEKIDRARSFLTKFEQARLTIREADIMLNALLKANENAKQLTGMWKQTGEELMVERASLIEEVKCLRSSISVKEREQDETHYKLAEIANSISSLEECFMQLKIDVEKRLKDIYSDVYSMGIEMLSFVSSSRSLLEDIWYETLKKGFASFVLYQCHLEELIRKLPCLNVDMGFHLSRSPESYTEVNKLQNISSSGKGEIMITCKKSIDEGDQREVATNAEGGELSLDSLINENLSLKKELQRKEVLLEGLLFDFRLLQESASNRKDIKDETENLICFLHQVRHELEMKTSQLDDMLVQNQKLERHLNDTEKALFISNSKLDQATKESETFSDQIVELKMLLKDLYIRKSEAEEQLEEQKEIVKSMENEILQLTSSAEMKFLSSVESIEDNMRRIASERDQLIEEVQSLNNKLEMAYALAEENEAIAVEARQESEASKIYAEQKEEEVKILERSVEELECTINVLEKKVYEMDDEVERHRLIRDSLELELQALRQRLSTVENSAGIVDSDNINAEQTQIYVKLQNISLELHEAHTQIKLLEEERAEQDKEIKQCKEYISELVLHAEAQASQYQQKYKTLEAMVREVQIDSTNPTSTASTSYQTEKGSVRTRGSSSPFRCIAGLVQQMNLEKDQELSAARHQIEELEALATSRQREVCMLNTRLAAAESMTHDVIRDLLGVKLDMTNFANLIDQHQVEKLVEEAHQQTEEFHAKEQEIINFRKQINDLIEERESCILEISKREGDILASQITIQQLKERDQLLSAQNEMLKMDKANLKKKVAELDDMVKTILGTKATEQRIQQSSMTKKSSLKLGDADFAKRLEQSEKLLSRVNGELCQYHKPSSSHPHDKTVGHGLETNFRRQKAKFG
ncbi:hypothetical protein FEM48_Zijuj08G0196300 [Ziziphus jujuba var. spinosa]|uniref:Kinesin motor domain-containing protein n=1 Tax=Ziziphus jujuba var. spinosa TaxID=714518 RepID=A0A978V0Z9_ZIZJJ|nr:hypothetical protein FEM48_Zijuj08G0196300 [Ziziphus jujuba var. spinosa]